jgi:hypothetical protein
MTIPAWILDIFAAIMLVVAAVSAARLVARRPWHLGRDAVVADIDLAHLLMAIAMAGMLTASLHTLPDGVWAAVFGVLTAWFGLHVVRDVRVQGIRALAGDCCAPHLVHSAAMLYMFLAITAPAAASGSGTAGMGGAGAAMQTLALPVLALIFAILLIGYCVWDLDQISGPGVSGHYSLAVPRIAPAGAILAGVGAHGGGQDGTELRTEVVLASSRPLGTEAAKPTAPGQAPSSATTPTGSGPGRTVLAPWVATTSRIAMAVTMAFMLMIMV